MRISIKEDGLMDDHEAAELARGLLQSNKWDLVMAASAFQGRARPASPPEIEEAGASSSRAPEVFRHPDMLGVMRGVLERTDAMPARSFHELSINMPPLSEFPTDAEVQYMTVTGQRDLSE